MLKSKFLNQIQCRGLSILCDHIKTGLVEYDPEDDKFKGKASDGKEVMLGSASPGTYEYIYANPSPEHW